MYYQNYSCDTLLRLVFRCNVLLLKKFISRSFCFFVFVLLVWFPKGFCLWKVILHMNIAERKTTAMHKTCENTSFQRPVFSRIRTESTTLSSYGRMRVSEHPESRIFYAVELKWIVPLYCFDLNFFFFFFLFFFVLQWDSIWFYCVEDGWN